MADNEKQPMPNDIGRKLALIKMAIVVDMFDALRYPDRQPDAIMAPSPFDGAPTLQRVPEGLMKDPAIPNAVKSQRILSLFRPTARTLFERNVPLPDDVYPKVFDFASNAVRQWGVVQHVNPAGKPLSVAHILPEEPVITRMVQETLKPRYEENLRCKELEVFISQAFVLGHPESGDAVS